MAVNDTAVQRRAKPQPPQRRVGRRFGASPVRRVSPIRRLRHVPARTRRLLIKGFQRATRREVLLLEVQSVLLGKRIDELRSNPIEHRDSAYDVESLRQDFLSPDRAARRPRSESHLQNSSAGGQELVRKPSGYWRSLDQSEIQNLCGKRSTKSKVTRPSLLVSEVVRLASSLWWRSNARCFFNAPGSDAATTAAIATFKTTATTAPRRCMGGAVPRRRGSPTGGCTRPQPPSIAAPLKT